MVKKDDIISKKTLADIRKLVKLIDESESQLNIVLLQIERLK